MCYHEHIEANNNASEVMNVSEKEKAEVLETFKNLPKDIQMAVVAGKTLADLERSESKQSQN